MDERLTAKQVIESLGLTPVMSEIRHASERPITVSFTDEVADSHLYIGVFYLTNSIPTKSEFVRARANDIPTLIFIKKTTGDAIERELQAFLDDIRDPKTGVTARSFSHIIQFKKDLRTALLQQLVEKFHSYKKYERETRTLKASENKPTEEPYMATESVKKKYSGAERLRNQGINISADFSKAQIIEYAIQNELVQGGSYEVRAAVRGKARNAFLDLLLIGPDGKQHWFPDLKSWNSKSDRGILQLDAANKYDSRWTFYAPQYGTAGDYQAFMLLFEDNHDATYR